MLQTSLTCAACQSDRKKNEQMVIDRDFLMGKARRIMDVRSERDNYLVRYRHEGIKRKVSNDCEMRA
jgi:hypothetical protein